MSRRRARIFLLVVVGVALAVRLVHLLVFSGATVFFDPAPWNTPAHPLGPGEVDVWAMQIVHGDPWWTDHGPGLHFDSPLYPYFVAAIYFIVGSRCVLAVAIAQAILGALTCGVVGLTARRFLSARAGWIAGGLGAVYGPAIFYESFLLRETLATFLVATAVWWSLRLIGGGHDSPTVTVDTLRGRAFLFAGVLWGMAVATWPLLLPVAVAVLGWAAFRAGVVPRARLLAGPGGGSWHRVVLASGWLLCGFFLAILPVTVRNVVAEERFVLIADAGADHWAVGNSVDSSGTNLAVEGELLPVTSTRFWTLFVRKVGLFLRGDEIPQATDYRLWRWDSPVLSLPVLGFGTLAPLALAGFGVTRRRWRELLPVHALALIYPLSVALFFVVGRFRLPVMPAFLLLAAAMVDGLWRGAGQWRTNVDEGVDNGRRSGKTASVWVVGAFAVLLVIINLPWLLPRGAYPVHEAMASYYLDMGHASTANGREEAALDAYDRMLSLPSPAHRALAHNGLAGVHLRLRDRPEEAIHELQRSLEIDPGQPGAATIRETLDRLESEIASAPAVE